MNLAGGGNSLARIKNPLLKKYVSIYENVYMDYLEQVQAQGLSLDRDLNEERNTLLAKLRLKGVSFRNAGKSIYLNWLSPACEACRQGVGSVTFFLSLMCHRRCYYCFNPNQEGYAYYRRHLRDYRVELDQLAKSGQKVSYIALTGGEPLLHRRETVDFFSLAKEKFPRAHTRLYTSGDLLDAELLQQLQKAGLTEIRFSVKLEDDFSSKQKVYERMALAQEYIRDVMVEMPVIPGTLQEMKELLLTLNTMGIKGINLLEFCFPFHNRESFQKRGFKIKNPPFLILYNYWYAGGLPVSKSELECLELLDFALAEQLKIGIHYCSLENKHTGQVYQQNFKHPKSDLLYFSPQDYFLKTAKVFGDDIPLVLQRFKQKNVLKYKQNNEYQFLEFNVKNIRHLKGLDLEVGISSAILEERSDGVVLRELKVDVIQPDDFNLRDL
ncbi:MAG TPA: radical SAM protein [Peptococcaceae bacterium]|nr:radical SAM protein [Peptococcaceae bacterium]